MLCAQHLDSTPNQYIQWRYGIGEDREQLQKVNLKVSEEEEKKMAEKQVCLTALALHVHGVLMV